MADTTTSNRRDVVTRIRRQHDTIRRLFDDVEAAAPAGRAAAFQPLVRLLAVHETAEEMVVHPAARRAETGNEVVALRVGEEDEAKQLLADLEQMGVDDPGFDRALAAFERAVLDHAEREEDEEFPLLYEVHDEDVLRRMTAQLKVAEGMAPTHPHPHGPDGAIGNLVVGPFVSMVDRVRDAIRDVAS
jgi:hemerythrin superfamily protein